MNLTKISSVLLVGIALTACGGGSSDHQQTSNNPNIPNQPEKIECIEGIPKNLKTAGSGFYDEEFFWLNTDYDAQNNEQFVIYSNILKNGVLFQNSTNLLKNALPLDDYSDSIDYTLTPSKLETTNKSRLTSSGIPLGYILSQNNDSAQFVMFTDSCNLSSDFQVSTHIKRIDLSGKKISELFAYKVNSKGQKEYTYLTNNLVHYMIWEKPEIGEKIKNSQFTFPQGSFIGFNDQEIYNVPAITFSEGDNVDKKTLDDYISSHPLPTGESWKKDTMGGLNVLYAINSNTGKYVYGIDPIVEMKGNLYNTEWAIPGNFIQYISDYETGQEVNELYFNKTAIQTIADAINATL
ncbi:hypothetical protein [Acinetobacter nematophilus]|uniref:Lipoprotein n=1 Tax=Acinetobacter nematophilus TaxID=2994642 RepID=A0A9X3IFK8_9GAMM|nr:hypothetical protein [Acinetobacter nematophilus]MCX5466747.1 hypothetical protein [Acinetobacter nematophilus]